MTENGTLDGTGEDVSGHSILDGTDLEIAYNLTGDDLVLRVNKNGVQVLRVKLLDALEELTGTQLMNFGVGAANAEAATPETRRNRQKNLKALPACIAAFAHLAKVCRMSEAALFEDMVAQRWEELRRSGR